MRWRDRVPLTVRATEASVQSCHPNIYQHKHRAQTHPSQSLVKSMKGSTPISMDSGAGVVSGGGGGVGGRCSAAVWAACSMVLCSFSCSTRPRISACIFPFWPSNSSSCRALLFGREAEKLGLTVYEAQDCRLCNQLFKAELAEQSKCDRDRDPTTLQPSHANSALLASQMDPLATQHKTSTFHSIAYWQASPLPPPPKKHPNRVKTHTKRA